MYLHPTRARQPQLPYDLNTVIFIEVLAVAWAESARQSNKDAEKVRARTRRMTSSSEQPAPLAPLCRRGVRLRLRCCAVAES